MAAVTEQTHSMATTDIPTHVRAYQREMFEESLKGNRIIVMDTGSGKTQVAILRIQVELERCSTDPAYKRVWFLAPTVQLCEQQSGVLERAFPAHVIRLLTGQDNVDKWSDSHTWNSALDGARIVVSTHAVLSDALSHGFVRLTALALLVFDEAHHCTKNHPANVIMKNFYHDLKSQGQAVPNVIGLSASLVNSSNRKAFDTIEANLDALSITPRLHRTDLMQHVHRPDCRVVYYQAVNLSQHDVPYHSILTRATYRNANMTCGEQSSSKHDPIKETHRALQKLLTTTIYVHTELGASAADFFLRETVTVLRANSSAMPEFQLDVTNTTLSRLLRLLDGVVANDVSTSRNPFPEVSPKVQCLLNYLLDNHEDGLRGIVFVQRRVIARILCDILNAHALSDGRLKCVYNVGTSNSSQKKFGITDLIDRKYQGLALPNFRQGQANIIVATSVLEEGIDVQACNVVACFDSPPNIKAYIQRRGRARHRSSRYALFVDDEADGEKLAQWKGLEKELEKKCQEDREINEICRFREAQNEEQDYCLQTSVAKLDATAALQHLYSFCAQLSRHSFADSEPQFSYQTTDLEFITATVSLPYSVPLAARYASSKKSWRSEKAARRDAAFHAYAALWKAGLLNEHLLPIAEEWNPSEGLQRAPPPARSMVEQPSFWVAPDGEDHWHSMMIHLKPVSTRGNLSSCRKPNMTVALHVCRWLATPPPLELRWSRHVSIQVKYDPAAVENRPTSQDLGIMSHFTKMVHRAPRSPNYWQGGEESLLALFQPPSSNSSPLDDVEQPVSDIHGQEIAEGIVRVTTRGSKPYQFRRWAQNRQVVSIPLPKHRGFPSPPKQGEASTEGGNEDSPNTGRKREEIFSIDDCTISVISMDLVQLGLYMPTILQQLHDFTVVDRFMTERLSGLNSLDRDQVRAAITAPSANRPVNYQRLEFVGDSALKFIVTRHLYLTHPDWPEGYLSRRRSFLVCNATLAAAALEAEIGSYVICDPVSYKDWKIPSISSPRTKREVSSKLLADVLEAILGVAWICGGVELTLKCTKLFIPQLLHSSIPPPMQSLRMDKTHNCAELEELIGHTFRNASLLSQALTHPSIAQVQRTVSYERLEFLGDAVLDLLLTEIFTRRLETLTQGEMTQIRSAVVNGDLLGFMCFNSGYGITNRAIVTEATNGHPMEVRESRERSLADHLYFHPDLAEIHHDNRERFKTARDSIADQLQNGETHPWDELKMLKLNKMFSDMVESIFGAVFLDAGEDMDACRKFFERLGLSRYAWRLVDREITPAYEGVRLEA